MLSSRGVKGSNPHFDGAVGIAAAPQKKSMKRVESARGRAIGHCDAEACGREDFLMPGQGEKDKIQNGL